jgi:hypothetical protein
MIFTLEKKGGYSNADLYVAHRKDTHDPFRWGEPKMQERLLIKAKLGPLVPFFIMKIMLKKFILQVIVKEVLVGMVIHTLARIKMENLQYLY